MRELRKSGKILFSVFPWAFYFLEVPKKDMSQVTRSKWTRTKVLDLVKPWADAPTVKTEQTLLEVIQLIEETGLNQLPVVRDNNIVVGCVEKASILELLQKQAKAKAKTVK